MKNQDINKNNNSNWIILPQYGVEVRPGEAAQEGRHGQGNQEEETQGRVKQIYQSST